MKKLTKREAERLTYQLRIKHGNVKKAKLLSGLAINTIKKAAEGKELNSSNIEKIHFILQNPF